MTAVSYKYGILNGLGCPDCGGTCGQNSFSSSNLLRVGQKTLFGLGAAADYDLIRIGGGTYTANQLLDKSIRANRDTKLYKHTSLTAPIVGTVKAGEIIGKVYSYIKATEPGANGRSWLMFGDSFETTFYVPNELVSNTGLQEQGTKTVTQEVKEEQDAQKKQDSPTEYYLSKYGTKALLIIGGIVVAATIGKQLVSSALSKKTAPAAALSGITKKRRTRKK